MFSSIIIIIRIVIIMIMSPVGGTTLKAAPLELHGCAVRSMKVRESGILTYPHRPQLVLTRGQNRRNPCTLWPCGNREWEAFYRCLKGGDAGYEAQAWGDAGHEPQEWQGGSTKARWVKPSWSACLLSGRKPSLGVPWGLALCNPKANNVGSWRFSQPQKWQSVCGNDVIWGFRSMAPLSRHLCRRVATHPHESSRGPQWVVRVRLECTLVARTGWPAAGNANDYIPSKRRLLVRSRARGAGGVNPCLFLSACTG